jgi:hypothetical protein
MALSDNTKRALVHLKKLTATDGWSVELKLGEVRLLRRSIPLTDNFFLDLYVEPGERTVGILSSSGRSQVLVDASGRPVGGRVLQLITCPSYRKESARVPVVDAVRDHPYAMDDVLTDQENKKLLLFAAYAIGAAIAFRVVLQAFFYVYLLAFPLVYLYAVQSCPPDESFDAKQQLKRVMRGHHLADDHPDKPKGLFHTTIAKVAASLTTELSTSLGYDVAMYHVGGAFTVARVTVPSVNRTFLWVGALHQWRYMYSQELETRLD